VDTGPTRRDGGARRQGHGNVASTGNAAQTTQVLRLKSPPAVGARGYYPTQSRIRYPAQANEDTISMEGWRQHCQARELSAGNIPLAEHH
jgi:hypothetical protein